MLTFDIETNGFLRTLTKVHCLWIHDSDTGGFTGYSSELGDVEEGIKRLSRAPEICGHNIVQFDLPAIHKIYPWFNYTGKIWDTLIMSRLGMPDILGTDLKNPEWNKSLAPVKLLGLHSLKSWGYRLGVHKGILPDETWEKLTDEMYAYNRQDVVVTLELFQWLQSHVEISPDALELETEVAKVIARQEAFGVHFDEKSAWEFYGKLCDERAKALEHLRTIFPPIRKLVKEFVAKVNNSKLGYQKGDLIQKYEEIEFNPDSNDHVEYWLRKRHNWEPSVFTEGGSPKIDKEVLDDLDNLPEVPAIIRYKMLTKRISQLADGTEGWLRHYDKGNIYGSVAPSGAVTRRMTHSSPNLAQVPAKPKPYWGECRGLFGPPPGYIMVGCDASQLELRTMAHLMYKYDGGAYVTAATKGSKENNDDIHCLNAKAFGTTRDQGKTCFYAMVYGAGDEKLGRTKTKSWDRQGNRREGKRLRDNLMTGLPALKKLLETIQAVYKSRGFFVDADGQKFKLRSTHSAFNMINQRLGAIVMKRAMVLLDSELKVWGLVPGDHYEFMLTVHDEWQLAVKPEHAELVGKLAVQAIRDAGEYYHLKCPLDGEYQIGKNWKETH